MSSSEPTPSSQKRLDGIDLLRGLAIFFVLVEHVHIRLALAKVPYTKFLPAQLWHFLVGNGELGVQMFFAVSGFLIASISLRRWAPLSEIKVRDFYVLRFARIAPLFLLLLAVLSGLHFAHVPNYVVTARTGGLGRALLAATHVSHKRAGSSHLVSAGQLGHPVVSVSRGDVLSFLSPCLLPVCWQ
jgi:peptidoglycan/LPS O-acetylase OafA/YrhL